MLLSHRMLPLLPPMMQLLLPAAPPPLLADGRPRAAADDDGAGSPLRGTRWLSWRDGRSGASEARAAVDV